VVVFFNGHKIFRDKFDRTIGFECGYGVWRHFQQYFSYIVASIRFEKIFLMDFTIKEKIREKMSKIHWFKRITVYSNLPCQENYSLQQFTVSQNYSLQQFTVSQNYSLQQFSVSQNYSLHQFTVSQNYSLQQFTVSQNYSLQQFTVSQNYSLQQFTVSRELQFTAIYCVKKITVYSNLPCQENYCLQQFTVSITLLFIAIYRVKQITV
jgi:hypothetical protein